MDPREQLVDGVKEFLVGPIHNEKLSEKNQPLEMYTSGVLFPKSTPQDELDKEGKDDGSYSGEDQDNREETEKFYRQNSIGLKVQIKAGTEKIRLEINYGKYTLDNAVWTRHELANAKRIHCIDLSEETQEIEIMDRSNVVESRISWNVYHGTLLNIFLENAMEWVSVDNVNSQYSSNKLKTVDWRYAKKLNNQNSIFQPSMSIQSLGGTSPFEPITTNSRFDKSTEDELFDMLYADRKIFGSGYGCAAEWEDKDKPEYVRTSIIPTFQDNEIAKYSADDPSRPELIDMYDLCCFGGLEDDDNNRQTLASKLSPLIARYGDWIQRQYGQVQSMENRYGEIARDNLEKCTHALKRIRDGYVLLTDPDADVRILHSFILANRAMLYQRLHFTYALKNFKGEGGEKWPDPKTPNQQFWYPFQLAFIMMSINGVAFKDHSDNQVVDLVWFPTGGGKTEAYLGVAAFAMILRRLRHETEDGLGVSVIMRYTLRLLTLQQFERASTLICALEFLRRNLKNPDLGGEPFLLGLWVGSGLTPNHHQASKEFLEASGANPGRAIPGGSPCQTSYCPWCGNKITTRNYRQDQHNKWTLVRCTNEKSPCIFTDRGFAPTEILPLVTVDYDIYTRCPSMVIATVDKFARMPFRSDIANIFGKPARKCERHGFLPDEKYPPCTIEGEGTHRDGGRKVRNMSSTFPPDLIIQDELHLISGPLGTMVGLYETAVDFLTEKKPKIIASTATIKGAQDQIRKIFDRKQTTTFPPPGINRSDSFFWWNTGKKGKNFIGISFSHRSAKFILAKLYASILQKMQVVRLSKGVDDKSLDPYWTLVGYYNSIRELGGANRLVEDDVVDLMNFLSDFRYGDKNMARNPGTPENGIEELTGRKTQREINEIRDKLEKSLPNKDVISVLLATNMISVGIDIGRLSLMVVNGQPKTATEYIQSTGRVGRRSNSPGIVFVLFNPHKPRDLSHYENFGGFHSTMQKYVEPSTLTPFSIPAYTRGLHAVLISMIRLSNPFLAEKTCADKFTREDGKDATNFILDRFKSVEQVDEKSPSFEMFRRKLVTLQEEWEKFIRCVEKEESEHTVWYNNPYNSRDEKPKNDNVLMIEFARHGEQKSDSFPLSTPESLRDVEQQIELEYV